MLRPDDRVRLPIADTALFFNNCGSFRDVHALGDVSADGISPTLPELLLSAAAKTFEEVAAALAIRTQLLVDPLTERHHLP